MGRGMVSIISLLFTFNMLLGLTGCYEAIKDGVDNNLSNEIIERNDENSRENEFENSLLENGKEEEKNDSGNLLEKENSKLLIAYFSLPETKGNAKEDSTITVNGETLGNTQYVANLIQAQTGADLYRIEAKVPYNVEDHQALIDYARDEQEKDSRPEIKEKITNFEDYDTIFIGYPIWWSDLPQILYTFLESYDFSGKNIYLFSTNGGSGLAGTVSTITSKLNSANVHSNAFQLYRENMEQAPEKVETWLKEIGMLP